MQKVKAASLKARRSSPAFTLLELLIVILLLSLMSLLVFSTFVAKGKGESPVEATDLSKRLRAFSPEGGELLCLRECRECYFRKPGGDYQKGPWSFPGLKTYLVDEEGSAVEAAFGRFHDQKVCLRFHLYPNGSNDQMILQIRQKYYWLPAYFGSPHVFDSLEGARAYWLRNASILEDRGAYY